LRGKKKSFSHTLDLWGEFHFPMRKQDFTNQLPTTYNPFNLTTPFVGRLVVHVVSNPTSPMLTTLLKEKPYWSLLVDLSCVYAITTGWSFGLNLLLSRVTTLKLLLHIYSWPCFRFMGLVLEWLVVSAHLATDVVPEVFSW
jgi:hypothetical protein